MSAPKQHSSSSTKIPSWLEGASKDIVGQAGSLYRNSSYTPYTGQRVAGASDLEQQAFGMANNPNAYKQYMNPFTNDVLDYSANKLRDQYGQDRQHLQSQAASRGAFGSSRQTQLEGQAQKNFGDNLGNLYAQGQAAAFDRAQGQVQQNFGNLLEAGGLQRGLNQAGLDTNYQNFREQQDYPWMNLDRYRSITSGVPYSTSGGTSQGTSGGLGTQLLGLGATLGGGWLASSSKKVKDKRGPSKNVAGALSSIPVDHWNYKGDSTPHIGPYAEDFNQAIGKPPAPTIDMRDGMGAAIAGVGELHKRVAALEAKKGSPKKKHRGALPEAA